MQHRSSPNSIANLHLRNLQQPCDLLHGGWFAVVMLILSVLDVRIGLGGCWRWLSPTCLSPAGFSKEKIATGITFNAVFVGMSPLFSSIPTCHLAVLPFGVVLSFLLTVVRDGAFQKCCRYDAARDYQLYYRPLVQASYIELITRSTGLLLCAADERAV